MHNELHQRVKEGFLAEYSAPPQVVTRAPGRLEILGNHTDYNEGLVLSAAVDRAMYVAASARQNGTTSRVRDLRDNSSREFDVNAVGEAQPGDWANYIKGVVLALQKRGFQVPQFDACVLSSIPLAAGMSSSAAFEISIAYALGTLTEADLPWIEYARIGQEAENNYVGARTGLLDQFSSIKGQHSGLVYSDFRSLQVTNVPIPEGTALVVANSMVKHNLTGDYNERRERCEEAVAFLQQRADGIQALRDVNSGLLEQWRNKMDITTYRRALHIVTENERVQAGVEALKSNDVAAFGRLLFESHESSRLNFENSCQELDILVDLGKSLPGSLGARLSGGGFGGISVHLVEESEAETYRERLETAYRSRTGKTPQTMICHADKGAQVLETA